MQCNAQRWGRRCRDVCSWIRHSREISPCWTSAQLLHVCSAADRSPALFRHPPSAGIRIILLCIGLRCAKTDENGRTVPMRCGPFVQLLFTLVLLIFYRMTSILQSVVGLYAVAAANYIAGMSGWTRPCQKLPRVIYGVIKVQLAGRCVKYSWAPGRWRMNARSFSHVVTSY